MIHKVRGIVFRFTKFKDTSIIVTIFTDAFGLQSYIVNGVRSKNSKNKIALYQPLTLLQLVVYHRENANIERIREVNCYHPYQTIPTDITKSSIALFIGEVLIKSVKEESHADELFEFISTSLITLDTMQAGYENFHLVFLLRLSRYLGFGALNANEIMGPRVMDAASEKVLQVLVNAGYQDAVSMTNLQRRDILENLVRYYGDHLENFGEMKSLQVLKEIFS